jgi:hypothetical protein
MHSARDSGFPHSAFGFPPLPRYGPSVKLTLACMVAVLVCSFSTGCAGRGGKAKSSVRLYEGDTSPNIRMYEEKPGFPLNRL